METYRAYTKINGSLAEIRANGASPYDIAVYNGFTGTEEEWLASLKGKDGTEILDDTNSSTETVYSSNKVDELLKPLQDDSHSHSNKEILDKISESSDGTLLFNGEEIKGGDGGSATLDIPPKNPTNIIIKELDEKLTIYWKDPEDNIVDGTTFAKWGGTVLVINEDHPPVDETDGTVIVNNKERDKYSVNGIDITELTNNTKYYLYFIPYTKTGVYGYSDANRYIARPAKLLLNDVTNVKMTSTNKSVTVSWAEPTESKTENELTINRTKTIAVLKADSIPQDETDGQVYENQGGILYSDASHTFTVENGHDYYIGFFIYSDIDTIKHTIVETSVPTYSVVTVTTEEETLIGQTVTASWTESGEEKTLISSFDSTKSTQFKIPFVGDVNLYSTNGEKEAYNKFTTVAWQSYTRTLALKSLYPFASCSNAELAEMINAYYNGDITLDEVKSVWAVGDKRKISLSAMAATGVGETHVAQEQEIVILDFDHDTLATQVNSITKALISVQPLRVLSNGTTLEGGYMNSSNTNSGGWNSAARHTWCNNVFKAALPSYIQNLVKQVTKPYCAAYNNATISNVNDYVWLLSENEVFGTKTYSPAQEGTQYEYYKTTSNRIKYSGNATTQGTAQHWWERSPGSGSAVYFCAVYSDGTAGSGGASGARGLAPGFSI